jgi:hypothetical protein
LATDGALEPRRRPSPTWSIRRSGNRESTLVVHGQLADGQPVTLLGASGLAPIAPVSVARESWTPDSALLGVHLSAADDALFARVSVACST